MIINLRLKKKIIINGTYFIQTLSDSSDSEGVWGVASRDPEKYDSSDSEGVWGDASRDPEKYDFSDSEGVWGDASRDPE